MALVELIIYTLRNIYTQEDHIVTDFYRKKLNNVRHLKSKCRP